MTEALLGTSDFLDPIVHVVDMEVVNVREASSKHEKRIKTVSLAAEKAASDRSPPLSKPSPTDISDDRNNEKAYSTTESNGRNVGRGKQKVEIAEVEKNRN